jgi:DNA-binding NarL/FixJ family response regulator
MALILPAPDSLFDEVLPAAETLRVVVAEGQGLVRAGFRALLESQAGMRVAAEAATTGEAVAAAREARPDVVLVDMNLPGGGGLEAAHRILAHGDPGETSVLMLISTPGDEAVFGALRAGASGVLLRDADPEELVDAVRVVAGGDAVLAPSVARAVVADFLSRPQRLRSTPEQLEELTPRELEVVALVACGLSNEEISKRLVVTHATAKTHVSRALCKLHARDRAQLVVLAYEAGLVRPGPRWSEPPTPTAVAMPPVSRPVAQPFRPAAQRFRPAALRPVAA